MRKLTLVATGAMFIGAQATLAAPLPSASGQQLRGDDAPIVSVKHKKKKKMMKGDSMSGQGGMQGGNQGGQGGADTMKKQ